MEGGFFVKIHESAEDYLEAILKLRENHGMVRSIDIARELGFSKPSISVAMKAKVLGSTGLTKWKNRI